MVAISLEGVAKPALGQEVGEDQRSPVQGNTECQAQAWLRNLSKYQRKYACWAQILKEGWGDFTPDRNQLGYEGESPPSPCLTKRGRQLCKALCGRHLLELAQATRLRYQHLWIASCVRTHLVNRCGPKGIHCWVPGARERIQESIRERVDSPTDASLKTLLLPRCNFSGQTELDEVEGIKTPTGGYPP